MIRTRFQLQEMIKDILPYTQLWETAQNWLIKSEQWLQGTFLKIDPEKLTEELQSMWRLLHKLIKTFGETPPPRRMAETVKTKIDKFKKDLPVIQALGANGMRSRHWDQIEQIVGTGTYFFIIYELLRCRKELMSPF